MNINEVEGHRESPRPQLKKALKVLSLAFRAPIFFLLGCGYIQSGDTIIEIHDYFGKKEIWPNGDPKSTVPYDHKIHGELTFFVEEGKKIPEVPNKTSKFAGELEPIHRHNALGYGGNSSTFKGIRFRHEPVKKHKKT